MPNDAHIAGNNTWKFAIADADSPSITNVKATSATIKSEPAVYAKAQNSQGFTTAINTIGTKYSGTFEGYITSTDAIDPTGIPLSFTFLGVLYFIKSATFTYKKGEFAMASMEVEGYSSITS